VDYWVWDSGTPILNATASRLLLLTKPCPEASTPFFCTDPDGSNFCAGAGSSKGGAACHCITSTNLQSTLKP
jgi:hypothetical protein